MTSRYIYNIWCDDVRHEIGNKPSFMGVYTGKMVLPRTPMIVPKICVFIWAVTDKENPFTSLTVKLLTDNGKSLMESTYNLEEASKELDSPEVDTEKQVAILGLTITNVSVQEDCRYIEPIVDTGSEVMKGMKLRFSQS